jgi:plasmid stability protein
MKTLSIKNVPDRIHRRLKERARSHHRSLNGELLALLEKALDGAEDEAGSENIGDFMLASPLAGSGLEFSRDDDFGRELEL